MQMEKQEALLKEYERIIDRLYKSDEWFNSKGYNSWKEVDSKIRNKRVELEKEAHEMQKLLHKRLGIKRCG